MDDFADVELCVDCELVSATLDFPGAAPTDPDFGRYTCRRCGCAFTLDIRQPAA